ncbi:MAG: hypothetical protein ACSHWN_04690 [Methylophilaceae bacterium]
MKIEILTTFKDGRDEFVQGDTRTVEDKRGAGFIANGWAKNTDPNAEEIEVNAASGSVDLQINNVGHKTGDRHG